MKKVFLSGLAESKLLRLSEYLIENWDLKTRDKFFQKLSEKFDQISSHPDSCPQSTEFQGLYKCVVSRHITFYFRILPLSDEIEIVTVFDNRQNPDKLIGDIG